MSTLSKLLIALLCAGTVSCAALDRVVNITDPDTGEVTQTTVGDLAAGMVEDSGGPISDAIGSAVGLASGNPVVGMGAGAAVLSMIMAGASRMRRKKDPVVTTTKPAKKKA